jgi:hypothetical protein
MRLRRRRTYLSEEKWRGIVLASMIASGTISPAEAHLVKFVAAPPTPGEGRRGS